MFIFFPQAFEHAVVRLLPHSRSPRAIGTHPCSGCSAARTRTLLWYHLQPHACIMQFPPMHHAFGFGAWFCFSLTYLHIIALRSLTCTHTPRCLHEAVAFSAARICHVCTFSPIRFPYILVLSHHACRLCFWFYFQLTVSRVIIHWEFHFLVIILRSPTYMHLRFQLLLT